MVSLLFPFRLPWCEYGAILLKHGILYTVLCQNLGDHVSSLLWDPVPI